MNEPRVTHGGNLDAGMRDVSADDVREFLAHLAGHDAAIKRARQEQEYLRLAERGDWEHD